MLIPDPNEQPLVDFLDPCELYKKWVLPDLSPLYFNLNEQQRISDNFLKARLNLGTLQAALQPAQEADGAWSDSLENR